MVGRAGPTCDIITALQELGRNCCQEGMLGQYLVYLFFSGADGCYNRDYSFWQGDQTSVTFVVHKLGHFSRI